MNALLDADFRWDGSTSDLSQQFYRAHVHLSSAKSPQPPEAMAFAHEDLPDAIKSRLATLDLRFEELPPLLQRAVVWDSGYVYGSPQQLLRVYTSQNRTMAELAVSLESFRRMGCSARNCTSLYRSQFCDGDQILKAVHCVTEDIEENNRHVAMWATGPGRNVSDPESDAAVVPGMYLLRHQWTVREDEYLVYAIHTVEQERQPAWSQCPEANTNQASGLTVPCGVYRAQANKTKWQPPPSTALVSKWLETTSQEQQQGRKHRNVEVVCGIVGACIAVLAVAYFVWSCLKKRRRRQPLPPGFDVELLTTTAWTGKTPKKTSTNDARSYPSSIDHHGDSITGDSGLGMLLSDRHLAGKRLRFEDIHFEHQISKGAFGEVWLASYDSELVAVKRARQDKKQKFKDLQDFTAEIQLTASLDHPNLVRFIGVAWLSIDTLCMVVEYMPNGDLQAYVDAHFDTLAGFWTAEKTAIALGVARALVYLHSHSPPLIHRDIKAKNVLLDESLGARLVDFGVSRRRQVDLTMTAGIGTPFWTAPEVIEGLRYTESSDIYSFGVLLTELETCRLPYHDYRTRDDHNSTSAGPDCQSEVATQSSSPIVSSHAGAATANTHSNLVSSTLRPFLILNQVMNGTLRPSLSRTCPEWLRELANTCLRKDPAMRPTAAHLVEILNRQWSVLE